MEWNEINWRKVEKSVFKLQLRRIYQANIDAEVLPVGETPPANFLGNVRKLRRLQKTLIKSYNARLISVRRVTQDNSGKKTAGVDRVKSIEPKQHNLRSSARFFKKPISSRCLAYNFEDDSLILGTASPLPLGLAIIGSQLPDLDTTTSTIGKICFPISSWIEDRFPHRSVTHCLLATAAIA